MNTLNHFSNKRKGCLIGLCLLAVVSALNGTDMLDKACVMMPPNVLLTKWADCRSFIDKLDPAGDTNRNLFKRLQELNGGRKTEKQLHFENVVLVLNDRFFWIKTKTIAVWLLFAACLVGIISLFRGNVGKR